MTCVFLSLWYNYLHGLAIGQFTINRLSPVDKLRHLQHNISASIVRREHWQPTQPWSLPDIVKTTGKRRLIDSGVVRIICQPNSIAHTNFSIGLNDDMKSSNHSTDKLGYGHNYGGIPHTSFSIVVISQCLFDRVPSKFIDDLRAN